MILGLLMIFSLAMFLYYFTEHLNKKCKKQFEENCANLEKTHNLYNEFVSIETEWESANTIFNNEANKLILSLAENKINKDEFIILYANELNKRNEARKKAEDNMKKLEEETKNLMQKWLKK